MSITWRRAVSDGQSPFDLTYSQALQAVDRLNGRRDGKRGVPSMRQLNLLREADQSFNLSLTYLQRLIGQAHRLWSHERVAFEDEVATAREQLAERSARRDSLQDARAVAETKLNEACKIAAEPLSDDDLRPRTTEEEGLPVAAVEARRHAVRQQAVVNAEHHLEQIDRLQQDLQADLARAHQQVQNRHKKLLARAERVAAHVHERMDTYWSGVVDRHWAGRQLSLLPLPNLVVPDWVTNEDMPFEPTIDTGGWP